MDQNVKMDRGLVDQVWINLRWIMTNQVWINSHLLGGSRVDQFKVDQNRSVVDQL